jgi:hypothetical protein
VIHGLGGLLSTATGGLVSFGSPNTDRYHGGAIASVIVTIGIDSEALPADAERLGTKALEDGAGGVDNGGAALGISERPGPVLTAVTAVTLTAITLRATGVMPTRRRSRRRGWPSTRRKRVVP